MSNGSFKSSLRSTSSVHSDSPERSPEHDVVHRSVSRNSRVSGGSRPYPPVAVRRIWEASDREASPPLIASGSKPQDVEHEIEKVEVAEAASPHVEAPATQAPASLCVPGALTSLLTLSVCIVGTSAGSILWNSDLAVTIIAVVLVLSVIASCGTVLRISAVAILLSQYLAALRNLELDLSGRFVFRSRFSEVAALLRNFELCVFRLKEYKSVLPSSFFDEGSQVIASAASQAPSVVSSVVTHSHKALLLQSRGSFRSSGARSVGSSKVVAHGLSLVARKCTICVVDWQDFHALQRHVAVDRIVDMHGQFIEEARKAFKSRRAALDRFLGDKMMATWPAAAGQANHAQLGCSAALTCHQFLSRMAGNWAAQGLPQSQFRLAVVTGNVYVGYVGSKSMRAFSVFGPLVNWCYALNKMAPAILVDDPTYLAVQTNFTLVALDVIDTSVFKERPSTLVYHLVAANTRETSEPVSASDYYNQGFRSYCEGHYDAGTEYMRKAFAAGIGDLDVTFSAFTRLVNRILVANHLPPVDIGRGSAPQALDLLPRRGISLNSISMKPVARRATQPFQPHDVLLP
eukprot:TRINITY_DN54126_c0_g1_i1.p1 TRINITY_DN54126_c0_g1~~TRINITY_DN54126_c0_g1_i1.p1  ORF type:complete len:574 (+),score=65.06 TRINITY_DN54126_c0_g1_i1:61-1782(+)